MLYLPGLKNVAADILSRPSPLPRNSLKQSPPRRRQIQWILKLWLPSKIAAQKRSACQAVHHSIWPFIKQAPNASLAMFQQAFFAPLSHRNSENTFISIFTTFHIRGGWASGVQYSRFVWRGLTTDITAWSRACLHRQQAKIHRHTRLQPQPVPIPQRHFSHLHIYLVGTLQYNSGCNFIFPVTDRTSKWMEAIPVSDTSAAASAKALILSRISLIWSAQNDHFRSWDAIYFKYLVQALHISHRQTTAYHPELNGAVKRLHRHLKDALRARAAMATWSKELPFLLLGLR